jgi:hypothetical protein
MKSHIWWTAKGDKNEAVHKEPMAYIEKSGHPSGDMDGCFPSG